jgi:hypothetical protein
MKTQSNKAPQVTSQAMATRPNSSANKERTCVASKTYTHVHLPIHAVVIGGDGAGPPGHVPWLARELVRQPVDAIRGALNDHLQISRVANGYSNGNGNGVGGSDLITGQK